MADKNNKGGNPRGKDFKDRKFKGKDKFEKEFPKDKIGTNDIQWYVVSEQMLNDVARLPFGRPLGNAQEVGLLTPKFLNGSFVIDRANKPLVIPGIAIINYRHSYGISGDAASPINVAARAIYSYVRHANSGHANYESPDLMIYLFAVGEIYAGISYLQKVYGVTQFWSQRNRYFGDRLVEALGFDATDVREHLSDFRAQINLLAVKANSLSAPKNISLYERRYFLPTHVYKDQDNEKAQLYTFRPVALGRFSGTKANTGSILIPVACPWASGNCTVQDAIDYMNLFLDEMLAEEDLGIMSGDILKAFGDGGIHQLLTIPDAYCVTPVYNEEMLCQIHNMNIGAYNQPVQETNYPSWTITISTANDILRVNGGTGFLGQLNGYLLTEFTTRNYEAVISYITRNKNDGTGAVNGSALKLPKVAEFIMDSHLDQPDPKEVMIASRLFFDISEVNYTYSSATHYVLKSCGTEVVTSIDVISTDDKRTLSSKAVVESRCEYGDGTTYTTIVGIADDSNNSYEEDEEAAHMLLKFRKAPLVLQCKIEYEFSTTGSANLSTATFGWKFLNDVDVVYASPIDSRVLENLHQSALLSIFKVPQMGMWNVK